MSVQRIASLTPVQTEDHISVLLLTYPQYQNICAQQSQYILGAILYKEETELIKVHQKVPWPTVSSALPALSKQCVELYLSKHPATYQIDSDFHIAYTEECLFATSYFTKALQENTYRRYLQICKQMQLRKHNIYRMWNEIEIINESDDNIERYQLFCSGRARAFSEQQWDKQKLPAASAIGAQTAGCQIYYLSGKQHCKQVENEMQMSAFEYPQQYGKDSPSFSRAQFYTDKGRHKLFISGTASILGHQSLFIDDIKQQTLQSLRNIDSLINTCQQQLTSEFCPKSALLRVYIRHAADFSVVSRNVEKAGYQAENILYLVADICRQELLVEIEMQLSTITQR